MKVMVAVLMYTLFIGALCMLVFTAFVRPISDESAFTNGLTVGVRAMQCLMTGEISGELKFTAGDEIVAHRHELIRSHTCYDLKPIVEK
jgi:hypothetical protein